MIKAAINGFGRIGRLALRVWLTREDLQNQVDIVAINTSGSMPVAGWAQVFKYDTAYGPYPEKVNFQEVKDPKEISDADPLIGYLLIKDKKIPVLAQREPKK